MSKVKKGLLLVCVGLFVIVATLALASCGNVTLTFKTDANTVYATVKGDEGEEVTLPDDPTLDGYLFDGWYLKADCSGEKQEITVFPASNTTYYAKWLENQVAYTVEVYLQSTSLSTYLLSSENSTSGTGTIGEANTISIPSITGFTHVSNSSEITTLTLSSDSSQNVYRVYYARNAYTVSYNGASYSGYYPQGSTESTSVVYGVDSYAAESTFDFDGYRLAGWALEAGGEIAYHAGDLLDVTADTTLYAVWEKCYADRFGGSDYISISSEDDTVVYLLRDGLEEKAGEYVSSTNVFTFEVTDDLTLTGKFNLTDYTFAYLDEDAANTYYCYDNGALTSDTLVLDGYYTATLTLGGTDYTGTYAAASDDGYYIFSCDELEDDVTFLLSVYGSESTPIFFMVGEEYGYYFLFTPMAYESGYNSYGYYGYYEGVQVLVLDGEGYATLYDYENSSLSSGVYGIGYYTVEDGVYTVELLDYYSYYYLNKQVSLFTGEAVLFDLNDGYSAFVWVDGYAGTYTNGSDTLVLDGYGYKATSALYTVGGTAHSGIYTVDTYQNGDVAITLAEATGDGFAYYTFLISVSEKSFTVATTNEGYAQYMLWAADEEGEYALGSSYLVLNGITSEGSGTANLYTCSYDSESGAYVLGDSPVSGTYSYNSANGLYTFTSTDSTFSFLPFTVTTTVGSVSTEVEIYLLFADGNYKTYTGETYYGDTAYADVIVLHESGIAVRTYRGGSGTGYASVNSDEFGDEILIYVYESTYFYVYESTYFYFVVSDTTMTNIADGSLYGYAYDYYGDPYSEDGSTYYDYLVFQANENGLMYRDYYEDEDGDLIMVGYAGTYTVTDGVYTFTATTESEEGTTTYTMTFALDTDTMIFRVYDEDKNVTLTSTNDAATIVIDGYLTAVWTDASGNVITGEYTYDEDYEVFVIIVDNSDYYYFTVDWDNSTFTARDSYAYNYYYDSVSGEALGNDCYTFDGEEYYYYYVYDSTSGWVISDYGVYGVYDEDMNMLVLTSSIYSTYQYIILGTDSSGYGIYYVFDELYEGTYVSENWETLTFDGCGNATYIDEKGVVYAATYEDADDDVAIVFTDGTGGYLFTLNDSDNTFSYAGTILYVYAGWYTEEEGDTTLSYTTSYGVYLYHHEKDGTTWSTVSGAMITGYDETDGLTGSYVSGADLTFDGTEYVVSYLSSSYCYLYTVDITYQESIGAYVYACTSFDYGAYSTYYADNDGTFYMYFYESTSTEEVEFFAAYYNDRAFALAGTYTIDGETCYVFCDLDGEICLAYNFISSTGVLVGTNFAVASSSDGYTVYVTYGTDGYPESVLALFYNDEAIEISSSDVPGYTATITAADGTEYTVAFEAVSGGGFTITVTTGSAS